MVLERSLYRSNFDSIRCRVPIPDTTLQWILDYLSDRKNNGGLGSQTTDIEKKELRSESNEEVEDGKISLQNSSEQKRNKKRTNERRK